VNAVVPTRAKTALVETACAICGRDVPATEVYPARLSRGLDAALFSARRLPDRIHFRIVRCSRCGLLRSDPSANPSDLAGLYEKSGFDYAAEVPHLRKTYGRYLRGLRRHRNSLHSLLEIGGGSGFVLEEALDLGFEKVRGVDPSAAAVASAAPRVREHIQARMMERGLFEPESFDAICMFQVLDHVADPVALLSECVTLLRPDGLLLLLQHDAGAWSARLLGERSPIVDVEHPYLYSRTTLRKLLSANGLTVVQSGAAVNLYSAGYLGRLLPLPRRTKAWFLRALARSGLGRMPLWVPLGNQYCIARRS
jgi:SAM-dependent methyltransferase